MPLPANAPGTCYKFIVSDANEAASVIRDRLGENARVLSVRTIEPTGLRSLWAAAKIEVLATVSSVASTPTTLNATSDELADPISDIVGGALRPDIATRRGVKPLPHAFHQPIARDLTALLRRSGFSDSTLGRLQNSSDWAALRALPLHRALVETSRTLQRIARSRKPVAPLTRAAFIGLAGSGRTTALCKWLALEVSRRARVGHVIAAEFDQALSRGPLPIFCEALGVPLAHFPASTQPAAPGAFVYFDLPPMSLRDPHANAPLASFLDREEIPQRVLVLNAAYGPDALRAGYARGRELQATHVVFTHLDERVQWGGLWDLLLDGGLEPLFLTTGPSLTGECEEDVYDALARRTLPVSEGWSPLSTAATGVGVETDAHLDADDEPAEDAA